MLALTRPTIAMLAFSSIASLNAGIITFTFESLSEGDILSTQFSSLQLNVTGDPVVLTAGSLLNEIDFPPRSGNNVLADLGGPILFLFTSPVQSVSAYFTYGVALRLEAFAFNGASLQVKTSDGVSNLGSSELIEFAGLPQDIGSLRVSGAPSGASFTIDDLTVTSVPEPSALYLLLFSLVPVLRHVRARGR